jgi:prokaryotic ubiquitin-like protein Pup
MSVPEAMVEPDKRREAARCGVHLGEAGDLMASKDSGGQKRTSKTSQETDETAAQEGTDVAERKEKLDEDIDAILDEIDEALEENSEEFVRGFVQKGGE